jgi:hypothetical protein
LFAEIALGIFIVTAMALNRRQVIPDRLAQDSSATEYVTENGFGVVRLCEVDGSVTDTARECRFLVRDASTSQREIIVHFEETLVTQIQSQRRNQRRMRLLETSLLWLLCAEQCLAKYLWENGNCPHGGRLNITKLTFDALLLATHWSDQQGD